MSDFARFCPKCYTLFRDPDKYVRHVVFCGTTKKKDTETVQAEKEEVKTADRRRQRKDGGKEEVRNTTAIENGAQSVAKESATAYNPPTAVSTKDGTTSAVTTETSGSPLAEEQPETVAPETPVPEQSSQRKSPKFKT
jgi:hypothetical protein